MKKAGAIWQLPLRNSCWAGTESWWNFESNFRVDCTLPNPGVGWIIILHRVTIGHLSLQPIFLLELHLHLVFSSRLALLFASSFSQLEQFLGRFLLANKWSDHVATFGLAAGRSEDLKIWQSEDLIIIIWESRELRWGMWHIFEQFGSLPLLPFLARVSPFHFHFICPKFLQLGCWLVRVRNTKSHYSALLFPQQRGLLAGLEANYAVKESLENVGKRKIRNLPFFETYYTSLIIFRGLNIKWKNFKASKLCFIFNVKCLQILNPKK